MVAIEKKPTLPSKAKLLSNIEDNLIKGVLGFNIKNRFMFPKYMPFDFYELHYDDIKKEYLIDFRDSEDNGYCLVPEYRTVIREYCKESYQNSFNLDFYYIEDSMSFSSPERKNITTSRMFGICSYNTTDSDDAFRQLTDCLWEDLKYLCVNYNKSIVPSIHYELNGRVKYLINGQSVGYALNETKDDFMSGHLSITDIYDQLIKTKIC